MIQKFTVALIALAFTACSVLNPPEAETASGRPEVTLASVDMQEIRTRITNEMLNQRYTSTEESSSRMVFEKPNTPGFGGKVLMGALGGSGNELDRVVFNFAPAGAGMRILADVVYVQNSRNGNNQVSPRRQYYPQWQEFLNTLGQ